MGNLVVRVIEVRKLDGTFVGQFNTISKAVEALSLQSDSNISQCACGKRNHAYGYIWEWKEISFVSLPNEIWKDIPEYQGLYKASNLGRIMSTQFHGQPDCRILKETTNKQGYRFVKIRIWKNHFSESLAVHRLVAKTFIPNPENKPQVDHIDTNPSNNTVTNLRWVTLLENQRNPITNKRLRKNMINMNKQKIGPKASALKKRRAVLFNDGTNIIKYNSLCDASRQTNISVSSIYKYCNSNSKGWSYA